MSQAAGSPRGIFGRGAGLGGWFFDVWIGILLAGLVTSIPLGLLTALLGDPLYLVTGLSSAAAVGGVTFMRRARAETGPAWFRS
jgi:hypothetical protein